MKITSKYLRKIIQEEMGAIVASPRLRGQHDRDGYASGLYEDDDDENSCWDGYKPGAQTGSKTKTKNGKRVPNCEEITETIGRSGLRRIILEEAGRIIPLDQFPGRNIEGWVDRQDPLDGLTALNTKINTLMTLIMVLNDNTASRGDLRDIRDEEEAREIEFGASMARVEEQ